jgi:hypothetical protein
MAGHPAANQRRNGSAEGVEGKLSRAIVDNVDLGSYGGTEAESRRSWPRSDHDAQDGAGNGIANKVCVHDTCNLAFD